MQWFIRKNNLYYSSELGAIYSIIWYSNIWYAHNNNATESSYCSSASHFIELRKKSKDIIIVQCTHFQIPHHWNSHQLDKLVQLAFLNNLPWYIHWYWNSDEDQSPPHVYYHHHLDYQHVLIDIELRACTHCSNYNIITLIIIVAASKRPPIFWTINTIHYIW